MNGSWRRRLLAAGTVFAGASVGLFADVGSSQPRFLPRTLADSRPATVGVVDPDFPVDFMAAAWAETHGHDHDDENGHEAPAAEVRFRHGQTWTDWQPMSEDGAQAEGSFGTALVPGADADAYLVRGVPAHGRLVSINTTDGPLEPAGKLRRGAAGATTPCRSRADWRADESLRTGTPDFQPVQVLTVHHTAGHNDDPDPSATVRAVYRYHTVDRGWSDIGYQYLIDQEGVVYEGRHSDRTSRSCLSQGGDGSDFAYTEDGTDRGVVGAHTGGWNSGNLGVAAMGTYTTVSPPAAQQSASGSTCPSRSTVTASPSP